MVLLQPLELSLGGCASCSSSSGAAAWAASEFGLHPLVLVL